MKRKYISDTALIGAAMAVSLFLTSLISAFITEKNLEKDIVRLHIIAASDSDYDQRLKLKVRDAVLSSSGELFGKYSSSEEAKERIAACLDSIKETAEKTLRENGCGDSVSCEITQMRFDRREYEDFAVPAGNYTALRITIGEGEGHNWWCVMYPPLCVPCAARDMTEEEFEEKYGSLTEEEYLMLCEESDYEARLYIAEVIKKLFSDK